MESKKCKTKIVALVIMAILLFVTIAILSHQSLFAYAYEDDRATMQVNIEINDKYYDDQWGLKDIHIEEAWDKSGMGRSDIRVGVIDSGIASHEDLDANVQPGYDFVNGNDITNEYESRHGTHIAGIIGAVANNGLGIAGVAPNTTLVPWQTIRDDGLHYSKEVVNAIKLAKSRWVIKEQKIHVLNYSVGGYGTKDSLSIATEVKKFLGLFVMSAGNEKTNVDTLPCIEQFKLSNIISVGSLTSTGERRFDSNYGTNVDIYAPGDEILSTVSPTICNNNECHIDEKSSERHFARGYHYVGGTSQAAPFVSGVAALMLGINPELTGSMLKELILKSADDINITDPQGNRMPAKKLNAYKAVQSVYGMYNVTINDGNGNISYNLMEYGQSYPQVAVSELPGYNFDGFYDSNGNIHDLKNEKVTGNITLTGRWSPKKWSIVYDVYADGMVTGMGDLIEMTYHKSHPTYGGSLTAPAVEGYIFKHWQKYNQYFEFNSDNVTYITDTKVTIYNVLPPNGIQYFLTACYEKDASCVAEDTLITLADGSRKPVQNVAAGDMLLVWNLFTGEFDSAPVLFVDNHGRREYTVTKLYFSDGTTLEVIDEHGLWDCDLNRYVMLGADAAKYIGDMFNKQSTDEFGNMSWEKVMLVGAVNEKRETTAYSPVTYAHYCYYVNGMLSVPGGISGMLNIFEVDEATMKYDGAAFERDVEKYGLYTYADFEGLITEEFFDAVGAKYLKVAVGKGNITWDEILVLIDRYPESTPVEHF